MRRRSELAFWNIPVTKCLDDAVEYAVREDMHVSKSDLIRDAVREKLAAMGFLTAPPTSKKEGRKS